MDDHIITIENFWPTWKMRIDLKELAQSAGKRVLDEDEGITYVPYPLTKGKRILKLIRRYGTEKDLEACDKYLMENSKLYKYWKEIRE